MKKIFIISTLFVSLLVSSCNNAEKEEEKKLAEEVAAIHDVVMPQMDEIMKMKSEIKAKIGQDTTKRKLGENLSLELAKADDGMMDWMQNFNPNYHNEGHSHEEIIKYFETERQKISQIKDQTTRSIEAAKVFVK